MSFAKQAGVMIIRSDLSGEDCLLLTKRTAHLASHGGEVAFPGGKWEESDQNLYDTALRETYEEVGIPKNALAFQGGLPEAVTRKGVRVSPFYSMLIEDVQISTCNFEIESFFWAPMEIFLSDRRMRTDLFNIENQVTWSPVYECNGHEIWGLTARLIVSFVNQYLGGSIARKNVAPELEFKPR